MLVVAAPASTAWKASVALSTSVASRSPVTVGVPSVALATPPASMTVPMLVPVIVAASLLPLIVTVTSFVVPSALRTVKLSVSAVLLVLSACTVGLALFSV